MRAAAFCAIGLVTLTVLAATAWWQEARDSPAATDGQRPWVAATVAPRLTDEMATIPGGVYRLGGGSGDAGRGAAPREIALAPFRIDRHEVTNRQFARFVAATGYRTTAEREGGGWVFRGGTRDWQYVAGADWRHPLGPGSSLAGGGEYPAVLVSWYDARAFSGWTGGRLPSEWEWEAAARAGGATDQGAAAAAEAGRANVWQGRWPQRNLLADGFFYAAPVGSFASDRLGLYDLIGNVWEWTASAYAAGDSRPVARGGSWFCSRRYCSSYRPGFRGKCPADHAFNNVGFRCARDAAR